MATAHQAAPTLRLPEPGQVVEARGSTWAVAEVRRQGLPRSSADEARAQFDHVVSLQSLDEDRLGEELEVVWELEVGNNVAPDQGLPETIDADGFDQPSQLAAFVDAVRWGAVTSADANAFQSPYRSGAAVEAYQLEPLRRALQAPRTNLLLADDVGLGKTIEAGLVVQELLLRHRARGVVVVCPPSLALKWQDEMREKFGLDFVIVNSQTMAEVRRSHGLAANPFHLFPRVIVSLSWLPTLRAQRLLRDVYAGVGKVNTARRFAFDILVVDEAHHVAPASPSATGERRGYAVDSQRTIATRALAERCEHRLFLSATPHNGHPESFTALLEMIDSRRFTRGATLDEKALKDVTVRRLKTEITDKDFQRREVKLLDFEPSADEQQVFERLDKLLTESARANGKRAGGDIVAMLLKKRFLSSPWAFGRTMTLYQESAAGAGVDWADDYYFEVLGSDQSDEEEGEPEHPEFTALRQSKASDPLRVASTAEIDQLAEWGLGFEHRPDSRLQRLIEFLDSVCRPDGKTWTNERVVVFTEYAATLDWIVGVLSSRGYADRLAAIQGGIPVEEREAIRERFSEHPAKDPVRVLVATDSAGEGIDLQAHCHRLVNFDIPFNPSRLEQRIGRIDRYGQRQAPQVFHLSPLRSASTYAADLGFLRRIAEKVANVEHDLGSVNQLIDGDIQRHFSLRDTQPLTRKPATTGEEAIAKTLAGGLELNRQLTELAAGYAETKDRMHLTPGNAKRVVDTALTIAGQPPLVPLGETEEGTTVFEVPALASSWQAALRGLDTRINPGVPRPVTFDDDLTPGRTDVVPIHLGHALMQKAGRLLRSSLYSSDSAMRRVSAIVVDGLEESCVAAISRLVLVGRGGLRLHEEVFLTGVRLRGRVIAEERVEKLLDRALDSDRLELADESVRRWLAEAWSDPARPVHDRLLQAMGGKSATRQRRVADQLATRERADIDRAREIFGAFRVNLRESRDRLQTEIAAEEELLFTDEQQEQRRRDLRAMVARLDSLDEEEAREVASLQERYADVRAHVSVAALVFAVTPEDAARGGLAP